MVRIFIVFTICLAAQAIALAGAAVNPDPLGVLRKPIPDKLVVLTFDDGPASHATFVAPLLKSLGFGGSFYICDFDSFKTRKDWYLTWRQMIAMADQGFEIGNHTVGHAGGSGIGPYLAMEDQLRANGVPKPETIAWPMFQVNANTFPELAANGYTFGRGGHNRPYRPTVDHPFDVPSMGAGTVEQFVACVRQAVDGRVVVLTFHGVPDMEHPACSVEPATFQRMMQYLKDNHYRVIALRDLAQYVAPAKAAKLPPTESHVKLASPAELAKEDKPWVAKDILTFRFPGLPPAPVAISSSEIIATVPKGTDTTALAAEVKLSPGASVAPAAGVARDFTTPQTYTVTGRDGSTKEYTVTVKTRPATAAAATAKPTELQQFTLSGPAAATIRGKLQATGDGSASITDPIALAGNLTIEGPARGALTISGLISGPGSLTNNGEGRVRITNRSNTYSGGTIVNRGSLDVFLTNEGLGTGSLTLYDSATLNLERVDGNNRLVLHGGRINGGNGFGNRWNGEILLNGNTEISSYATFTFNDERGGMSGLGGFTYVGTIGPFGLVSGGRILLCGRNTYTGPTIVRRGTLHILKAESLYNAHTANWTPAKISVHPAATLVISAGGPGEFTGEHVGALLRNLTASVDHNGLMPMALFAVDTANATHTVTVSADIADSKGSGDGAFVLTKRGAGALQLSGNNTYTGRTVLEGGALSVASLNSIVQGKAASSLGTPTDVENGEIVIGSGTHECALIYTGTGETTDRVMNLAGSTSTVIFDQSGSGLLKLTSDFVISGYGHPKTLILKGSTDGEGELACDLVDPYDRAGTATTAVTKTGTGTWTLSGNNSHSGPTSVIQGTLALTNARSLSAKTEVRISEGATLNLNFEGAMHVAKLYLDGKLQPTGTYSAANTARYLTGKGTLRVDPTER